MLGGFLSYSCTLDLVQIPICPLVSCHTHVIYIQNTFLCARRLPVILVFFRFSTHFYVLDGFLSYSCTLELVHIPMCSVASCHTRVLQIQYTFLCARWFPVILMYIRFSTHSYVLSGFLSYSCTVDLVHIRMCSMVSCHTRILQIQYTFLCARWLHVILITLYLAHIPMCSMVSCHTRVLQIQYTFICARWLPVILITLYLAHIPMCSMVSCHIRVLQIQYTFICSRWFPVILVYFRFSTHSYVLDGFLSYSCILY